MDPGKTVAYPTIAELARFSNLRLDDVTLNGNYRLPFAVLAEDANCPLNYARRDSNLRPSV
jgi:hypothetical protein